MLTLVKLQYDKEVRVEAQEMRLEPGVPLHTHTHLRVYISVTGKPDLGVPQLRCKLPQIRKKGSGSPAKCP